ncbi:MAG: site-2 protease family protein [Patescibacteria group bacterium]
MDFLPLLFYFIIIIPSAIMHEFAHGWMADRLGDPTARYAGRLTLDPRVHIDKIGTLFLPLALFFMTGGSFMFAYAKPVPYNPYNLRDQRLGSMWVAIAGPVANFLLALVFALFIRFMPGNAISPFLSIIVYANIVLGVFNLVPIPPLDGSKILYAVLPPSLDNVRATLERYGFVFLLVFIFFFSNWISPIVQAIYRLFTGGVVLF